MMLGMLKSSANWLDPKKAKLNINDNDANLSVIETINNKEGKGTKTTKILFINEHGWKIDKLVRETKLVDKNNLKQSSSEQMF